MPERRSKKYWLRSKTVWAGIVAVLSGLSTAVTAVLPLLGVMQSVWAPHYYLILVASLSGLSSILAATAIWARGQAEEQLTFRTKRQQARADAKAADQPQET